MLLFSSLEENSTNHHHHHHHPLELGRFPKDVSEAATLLILSCPPDLGLPLSLNRPNSTPSRSSLGTNPGRRCGGTNLSDFKGCGETKSFSFSWFKTGVGNRDEPTPVRPKGRSEIKSDPGSERGRSGTTCWIGFGLGCGGVTGLCVGRVRTRIRPCLLGAETAEYEADEKEEEDEREGFFDALVLLLLLLLVVVVMDLS